MQPVDPSAITLVDLQRSGAGGTVAGLLLDVQARTGGRLGPGLPASCSAD